MPYWMSRMFLSNMSWPLHRSGSVMCIGKGRSRTSVTEITLISTGCDMLTGNIRSSWEVKASLPTMRQCGKHREELCQRLGWKAKARTNRIWLRLREFTEEKLRSLSLWEDSAQELLQVSLGFSALLKMVAGWTMSIWNTRPITRRNQKGHMKAHA